MTTPLQAISEELKILRLRTYCLERTQEMIRPLYEFTESLPAVQIPTPANRRESKSPNATRAQLREYVVSHGPLTRGELVKALGGSPKAMGDKLRRLLADGEIGADGGPGVLLYRSPNAGGEPSEQSVAGRNGLPQARHPSVPTLPERGVYPMYDAIVDLDGATTEQLTKRMGLPMSVVVEQGRRLVQLGLVRFTKVGRERVWRSIRPGIAGDAA